MGIFLKLSSSEKNKLIAVFDIGSSSVGGALFLMQKSGVPKIIFSVREKIAFQNKASAKTFLAQTIKTLDNVAEQIATSYFGAPKKIFCVLPSPLYVLQNRVIKMKKNTPFIFTNKLADSLIKKEVKLFEEEYLEKHPESKNRIRVIELKNIKTILNGYEVINPNKQKVKEIEMTLFISMSEESILSKIEEVTIKHFHTKEIKFSSFLLASFTVVRDMYANQKDFLLIDIGGEITDISMVKKNLLRESSSYPIGSNFVVRNLASGLKSSLDEARSFFSLYKDGHAEEKLKQKIEVIMNKLKTKWLQDFQSSLANLSHDISVPANIFLTVDKEFADFFTELIKAEQFSQYTLTRSKFQITFLNTKVLHGVAVFENDIIRDPFLIIDTVYINHFLNLH